MTNLNKIKNKNIATKIKTWLEGPYDEKTKQEINDLIKKNKIEDLTNAFYTDCSFGTGGMRELMGVGTNRMNIYTVGFITQGLSNYLKKKKYKKPKVVICYDDRHNSDKFAKEAAIILSANNIQPLLFKAPRPTPLASYICRDKKASAAIMITASHNAANYNGYKVYWSDGAQVLPPHDLGIVDEIQKIKSPTQVKKTKLLKIQYLDTKADDKFIKKIHSVSKNASMTKKQGSKLSIIYTNLHGVGITLMPQALKSWGFTNITYVDKQKPLDPNFTYAKHPNPEEKKSLMLGINLLKKTKKDILIATDADSDRMSAVINHKNKQIILSGNQIAVIMLYYLSLFKSKTKKKLFCVKTIVTTSLIDKIAKEFNIESFSLLTGFKYIAEKIAEMKDAKFILGAEESYGYLATSDIRDKDGISSACLLSEIALYNKLKKKTLFDFLLEIYEKFGVYRDEAMSITFPEGAKSKKMIKEKLLKIEKSPPLKINNLKVIRIDDYKKSISKDMITKKEKKLTLPKSNVLTFHLADKTKITIRPSGTEPKIKIYIETCEEKINKIEDAIKICDRKQKKILQEIKELF